MGVLRGKKILLGVCGGIAAYKSAFLVRLLIKEGAEVRVILTPEALQFVTPLTLSTLSKQPVYTDFVDEESDFWVNHVELAKWADFMCIAPLTANTLSKLVNGQSDNFLLATFLSLEGNTYLSPAMDLDMYAHPATQRNLKKAAQMGEKIIPAESGELASGLVGKGRMAEPEHIVSFIEKDVSQGLKLLNKKILITAGPTYEAIDPVRFIGNHSSGKMGYALAEKAAEKGAEVTLISGPTQLKVYQSNINLVSVTSTRAMYEAVHNYYDNTDIVISAAAVSDYRPRQVARQKIKKKEDTFTLQLEKTEDILLSLGKEKKKQFLVGFALETENELTNAKEKLKKKNLDLIVLNSLKDTGAGFGEDTNKVKILSADNVWEFDLKPKPEVADDILELISNRL